MLQVKWSAGKGWGAPRIIPTGPVGLHLPFAHVFHYAIEVRTPSPSPRRRLRRIASFLRTKCRGPLHEDSPPPSPAVLRGHEGVRG